MTQSIPQLLQLALAALNSGDVLHRTRAVVELEAALSQPMGVAGIPESFPPRALRFLTIAANPESHWEDEDGESLTEDAGLALQWLSRASQPLAGQQDRGGEDSWADYKERCEHGVRWETPCSSCGRAPSSEATAAGQVSLSAVNWSDPRLTGAAPCPVMARGMTPLTDWQPIETAPKDGTHILAWNEEYGARETQMNFYGYGSQGHAKWESGDGPRESGWDWSEPKNNWGFNWKPTHWMPLPPAPSVGIVDSGNGGEKND